MSKHITLKGFTILIGILFIGLGFALALPWIVRAHIYAAQNESHKLDNAPTAPRYYVSISGGAIRNHGLDGVSSPELREVIFFGNTAEYGGRCITMARTMV